MVRRTPAFTLVELLATIAIIALLAALTVKGWQAASSLRERTQCVANLREIGSRFHQYAAENNGSFPAPKTDGQSWWMVIGKMENDAYDVTKPADNKIFRCPAAVHTYPNGIARRTYGLNADSGSQTLQVKSQSNSHLAKTLLVADMKSNPAEPVDAQFLFRASKAPVFSEWVDPRHGRLFNGLFADGHVETLSLGNPDVNEYITNIGR